MRTLAAVALLLLVAACQGAPPEAPPLDRQATADEVRQAFDAWLATGPSNDLEAGTQFFLDDVSGYYVGDPALFINNVTIYPTKARVLEVFEPSMANRSATHYMQENSSFVVLTADAVVQAYRGTYNVTNLDGETGPDYPMTASILWVRHAGVWKIAHYHQSWSTDIE
jgi:ketosteroid isomerase-like protein